MKPAHSKAGPFADYLVPTANEIPSIELLHMETPSPFTPLGAKGIAEGNCMSTPVCIANAVADALSLKDVPLPITPNRLNDLMAGDEATCPEGLLQPADQQHVQSAPASAAAETSSGISGQGQAFAPASPAEIWQTLLDPDSLQKIIPGCRSVRLAGPNHYAADVSLGVGPIRGRFDADVRLSDLQLNRSAVLTGGIEGLLGKSEGSGRLVLSPQSDGTRIEYSYEINVGGKVASVGGRMIQRAAEVVIGQFFQRLGRIAAGDETDGAMGRASSLRQATRQATGRVWLLAGELRREFSNRFAAVLFAP